MMTDSQNNALQEWRKRIFEEPAGEIPLGDVPVDIDGVPYVFKNVRMLGVEIGEIVDSDAINTFTIEGDSFQDGA